MPDRTDYPFVGRTGYRVSGPIEPGMRSHLTTKPRPHPVDAKPLDLPRAIYAARASKRAGFGK